MSYSRALTSRAWCYSRLAHLPYQLENRLLTLINKPNRALNTPSLQAFNESIGSFTILQPYLSQFIFVVI